MKRIVLLVFGLLASCIMGFAQTHWTATHPGPDAFILVGYITIDGEENTSNQIEIGSFNVSSSEPNTQPGVCVGADWDLAADNPALEGGHWLYVVTFYGTAATSNTPGDVVTFKLYDHNSGQELELNCEVTATLESNFGCIGCEFDEEHYFVFNFTTPSQTQTYELPITGYTGTADRYYLISSPIGEVRPAEVENMTTGEFDLYYFDQAQQLEWINIENGNTPLEAGKGYLYANSATTTLRFTGTPYSGTGTFPLSYTEDNPDEIMRGWNLVGNPFPNEASVDLDHYVMNGAGTDLITSTEPVAAMNGIFVKATATGQNVIFSQNSEGKSQVAINVLKDRGAAIDRAIVRFDANSILPKFMLDSNNTKIYIPQSGSQYAVVSSDNVNSLPVNFKARENGNYTLSIDITEVRMEYLHLIDNMTGADVDLLVQPDYHFTASSQDYETRFTLVFRAATGVEEQSQESFCFVNGRNLYFCEDVEGTTLSLVDMTGRTVRHETLKGNGVSLSNLSEGIYVVRLTNGNDTKVQKIVVK